MFLGEQVSLSRLAEDTTSPFEARGPCCRQQEQPCSWAESYIPQHGVNLVLEKCEWAQRLNTALVLQKLYL